ncbi:hypothetical protein [Candidatus Nitrosotenuis aquarius]|uniref:hypothetical protein n=1 Tax=Candidatus Nitrosotenuis aquarius TaxID=1846278 RepID=UPI000C1DEC24|nr:hypothetical protein [Candidatus Nitrosotenuis aquarius]
MSTSCKGVCTSFKAESAQNGARYTMGQKRCTYCSIYLQVDSINCPCCGSRLRSKARHRPQIQLFKD